MRCRGLRDTRFATTLSLLVSGNWVIASVVDFQSKSVHCPRDKRRRENLLRTAALAAPRSKRG